MCIRDRFTKSHHWHFVILNLPGIVSFLPFIVIKSFCHCRGICSNRYSIIRHDIYTFWYIIKTFTTKREIIYTNKVPFYSFLFIIIKDRNRKINGRKVENTNNIYDIATLSQWFAYSIHSFWWHYPHLLLTLSLCFSQI